MAELAEMEVKHRCNQILELGFPLGGIAKLFAQDWEGDVTVVMPATLAQVFNISHSFLSQISLALTGKLTNEFFLVIISIPRSYRIHLTLSFRRLQIRVGDAPGRSYQPLGQIVLLSWY